MKIHMLVAIILLSHLGLTQEPQIIDFTYAHVLQQVANNQDQKHTISISPDTKQMQKYRFPEICELQEKLEDGADQSNASANYVFDDEHLSSIRQRVLQLLRVSQKIKESKILLEEMRNSHHLYDQEANISKFDAELQRLANKQQDLAFLKQRIANLTSQLNATVHSYNDNPRAHQFYTITLNYQLQLANNKIKFYKDLKYKIDHKKPQSTVKYDDFFKSLQAQFENATQRINDIDLIISNYAHKKTLEQKIVSLNNRVQIDKLLMKEKEDCSNSKNKIKKSNHFSEELKNTFEDLRLKKKEFHGMNNTQCQGVAKKLEDKIRSQLKIINRAYNCSEGLEEIEETLRRKEKNLQELKLQLANLKLGEIELEHKNYNKTIQDINSQFQFMRTFSVSEYMHSSAQIEKLLSQQIKSKEEIMRKLSALPATATISIDNVQSLVAEIKALKAKYCKQHEDYETQYKSLWREIKLFEKANSQQSYKRRKYLEQGAILINLQDEYKQMSHYIVEFLKQNRPQN